MADVSPFNKFPLKFMVRGTQPFGDCIAEMTGVFTTLMGNGEVMVSVQPD